MKQRIIDLIHSRYMLSGVFIASVLEATVLPIALEIFLLPLMQARREKMWLIATVATLGCVVGAIGGYFAGAWLMDVVGPYVLDALDGEAQFNELKEAVQANGFWFVFAAGITPVPLQLAMLAAGATHYSFILYLIAITIARAIRYFGLTLLLWHFGDRAEKLVLRYKKPLLALASGVLLLFVAYQFVG